MTDNMEEIKNISFSEAVLIINKKYIDFVENLLEFFKHHNTLKGSLEGDIKLIKEKLVENEFEIIDILTDNFLYCLEQINDQNADYFIYQKEKITKKNGKTYKNKLPKIGNKTLLKRILSDLDVKSYDKTFKDILDFFNLLIIKEEETIYFNNEYINYVKENFNEHKFFSKMIMVFDNTDNILNSKINLNESDELGNENDDISEVKSKSKKNKSKKALGPDFMKNLENTKIAGLAKSISEKINLDEYPELQDPSKLLNAFTNSDPEGGGLPNLLKLVIGEVEDAFKNNNINQNDLVNEAQDIMGQFSNMSGFDPMSILKNGDINQFANIFSKMSK
jgi:hypothetical protein